jgi:hypothetical protein
MVSAVHDGYVLQKVRTILIYSFSRGGVHYLPVSNNDVPFFPLYISFENVINPSFSM